MAFYWSGRACRTTAAPCPEVKKISCSQGWCCFDQKTSKMDDSGKYMTAANQYVMNHAPSPYPCGGWGWHVVLTFLGVGPELFGAGCKLIVWTFAYPYELHFNPWIPFEAPKNLRSTISVEAPAMLQNCRKFAYTANMRWVLWQNLHQTLQGFTGSS